MLVTVKKGTTISTTTEKEERVSTKISWDVRKVVGVLVF